MKFRETAIPGVMVVETEPLRDQRGFFARLYCPDDFAEAGVPFNPAQTSLSRNTHALTLRGLHYQTHPFADSKLVRVVRGRAFDVSVDLRPDSPSYLNWFGIELNAEDAQAVLIPEGIAHGFLTLTPETDVLYQITPAFSPGHSAGVRWDDAAFAIDWPSRPEVISDRDATYADYRPEG